MIMMDICVRIYDALNLFQSVSLVPNRRVIFRIADLLEFEAPLDPFYHIRIVVSLLDQLCPRSVLRLIV